MTINFTELLAQREWRPIQGCPGRYVLLPSPSDVSVRDLVGSDTYTSLHECNETRDTVLVTPLVSGGLISFRRQDGRSVHTLCDANGFTRKLKQLEL